ncbi:hypothetical protein BDA96_07G114800 [Sorghum bicolor]|uniref:Uncharacterized protein n=1 Tax=Sorghum bicolor TaxID=4558 RepID=A0A921U9K7_SORBI|nr:hypothetical protein BDA96_07G114800 [Sorghum bicolor]
MSTAHNIPSSILLSFKHKANIIMKSPPTAKALAVATLSALLILLFFVLLCGSSSSSPLPRSQSQPSIVRSRRLLSTQCRDANSCSTPVGGFSQFFKAPAATVLESLKKMPKSRSNPSHN